MSDAVRVLKFVKHPEMRPKRGDPSSEQTDAKGFLVDSKGNRRMELRQVDWVYYTSPSINSYAITAERVEHVTPDPVFMRNSPDSLKAIFFKGRWDAIKPHYEAWTIGQEVPVNGTALGAWPALTPEQAEILRGRGLRTVEEIRDLTEGQIDRIPLPNVREIRRQAASFIENIGSAVSAERERQQADVIANLQAQLMEMREEMSKLHAPQPVEEEENEVEVLRAALDERGISYDKRWAAPKLRAALAPVAA